MSMNKVLLLGRLGNDPELRATKTGGNVANLSVATNEIYVDKAGVKQEKTEWHRVIVFGKLADLCGQYLQKGRQIFLEGRLQTRSWQDQSGQTKYTTEIVASTIEFLGSATAGSASRGDTSSPPREEERPQDDIPF